MAYLLTLAVFVITLVQAPLQSGGWYWDTGNAFGFLGFAGLLYLFLDTGRGRRQRAHKLISYVVYAALVSHAAWMWLADATLWHYMVWDAPLYMLAGWAALLLTLAIIVLALPQTRRFWHLNHNHFQRWHYWLSLAVVVAALWHMIGSGFYVSKLEAALYGVLLIAVLLAHRFRLFSSPSNSGTALLPIIIVLAFVLLKAIAT